MSHLEPIIIIIWLQRITAQRTAHEKKRSCEMRWHFSLDKSGGTGEDTSHIIIDTTALVRFCAGDCVDGGDGDVCATQKYQFSYCQQFYRSNARDFIYLFNFLSRSRVVSIHGVRRRAHFIWLISESFKFIVYFVINGGAYISLCIFPLRSLLCVFTPPLRIHSGILFHFFFFAQTKLLAKPHHRHHYYYYLFKLEARKKKRRNNQVEF